MVNVRVDGRITAPDSSINSDFQDTQPLHATATFYEELSDGFQPLHTVIAVTFQLILILALFITGLVLALAYWPAERQQCEPYFILIYIHAAFWCVSLVVHHHLNLKHEILRINGYLDFYKLTRLHLKIPFHIVSLWNAVLLVVTAIFQQVNQHFEEQCKQAGLFDRPITYLGIMVTAEMVALTPFLATYIVKVVKFNRMKPQPDVMRDDLMHSVQQDSVDAGDQLDISEPMNSRELLEKQADVIQFLRDHNARLSQKIVQLNAALSAQR